MKCCAVVDTNVLVSALLSKNSDAATVHVLRAMLQGRFIPLYHRDILAEYDEVLHRSKFHLTDDVIQTVLSAVIQYGIEVFPRPTGEILIDMDDIIFLILRSLMFVMLHYKENHIYHEQSSKLLMLLVG